MVLSSKRKMQVADFAQLFRNYATMPLTASANRDARRYKEPNRFDVFGKPRDHLAFGYGIHYCLGVQLARLEAKVAMDALLFEQPPFVRISEKITRVEGLAVRGPKTLPLRFETLRSALAAM